MSWFADTASDRAAAKGARTVLSVTDFDEVKAHVGQELGVSDRHLVGRLRCAC
jgi:hypothetical protein